MTSTALRTTKFF